MAFYLPKPIYKISNDENNDLLFVYGVGLPLYVYSKNDFTSPNYSNFYISSVEYDDVCLDYEEEITISDIFNNDISFNYKDLEIVNECKCKFSSTNYPFFLMNIDILIDSNGNNYIKSLDSSEYYLIKEKYKIF